MPEDLPKQSDRHWLNEFPLLEAPSVSDGQPAVGGIHYVEPIWVEVPRVGSNHGGGGGGIGVPERAGPAGSDPSAAGGAEQALPQLRLFVESEHEFERIYKEAAVAVYWEQSLIGAVL